MQVQLEYGDGHLDVEIPNDAVVVRSENATHEPPPLRDPVSATKDALEAPLGCDPIRGQVGPTSRVTIAFLTASRTARRRRRTARSCSP